MLIETRSLSLASMASTCGSFLGSSRAFISSRSRVRSLKFLGHLDAPELHLGVGDRRNVDLLERHHVAVFLGGDVLLVDLEPPLGLGLVDQHRGGQLVGIDLHGLLGRTSHSTYLPSAYAVMALSIRSFNLTFLALSASRMRSRFFSISARSCLSAIFRSKSTLSFLASSMATSRRRTIGRVRSGDSPRACTAWIVCS